MFLGYVLSSLGGMIYRFSPTTLAFRPNPESLYFPATIEVLVSLGFICMGVAGFLLIVKRFAILPAPLQDWHDMASYFRFRRPYIRWTGYFKYGHFGENETIETRLRLTAGTMAKRITIDPITRIEGHLRIDVEVENNAVSNAWASCTMWRGIEKILRGRDPRDAWMFTQRFCGVCTTVHAMASVRAVEDALKLEVPLNAQYIRNLILIAHALHDHIVHFYQLSALDWVDILQIPKADPAAASKLAESLSPWTRNSRNE